MVKRALAAFLGCIILVLSPPLDNAFALGRDQVIQSTQSSSDKNSDDGSGAQKDSGACRLYSTPSSFGLRCLGGSGVADTVLLLLHGEPAPHCWHDRISLKDLKELYNYDPPSDVTLTYFQFNCISGLDVDKSLAGQTNLQFHQQVFLKSTNAPPCAEPFTDAQTNVDCLMSLKTHQAEVIAGLDNGSRGYIPNAVLAPQPIAKVRTNVNMIYWDAAKPERSTDPKKTREVAAGGRTMWAVMTQSFIYPYGKNGQQIRCDVTLLVPAGVGADNQPCNWKYPRSSHKQLNERYPFRMETDWAVFYREGTVVQRLNATDYKKFDDIELPVLDIQTLVVP